MPFVFCMKDLDIYLFFAWKVFGISCLLWLICQSCILYVTKFNSYNCIYFETEGVLRYQRTIDQSKTCRQPTGHRPQAAKPRPAGSAPIAARPAVRTDARFHVKPLAWTPAQAVSGNHSPAKAPKLLRHRDRWEPRELRCSAECRPSGMGTRACLNSYSSRHRYRERLNRTSWH
jgi:hypothetical protein